jgi:hypothetical protein
VSKVASTLALAILGLVVLAAASPALVRLAGALVAPVVAGGIVVALLRCVWWLTGPR